MINNIEFHINTINKEIQKQNLDLSNLTIITEAASGPFLYTPIIAAIANAKAVYSISKNSKYGLFEDIKNKINEIQQIAGIESNQIIVTDRHEAPFESADIITNLGFVRPLDRNIIKRLKKTAVIPLMFESWEYRERDIDLKACRDYDIPVLGTNEDHPSIDLFRYSGLLAIKLLIESNIDFFSRKINIISNNKFGIVINEALNKLGAKSKILSNYSNPNISTDLCDEIFLTADNITANTLIGSEGEFSFFNNGKNISGNIFIQFAGKVEIDYIQNNGGLIYPNIELQPQNMVETLAGLGTFAVVKLHTAGLRVGELMHKWKIDGKDLNKILFDLPKEFRICQTLNY